MSLNVKWLKDSAVYVALGFLAPAINFFLAPLYTNYLTPEEYSLIFLSNLFGSFLINILSLGLSGAFTRYFFYYYKNDKLLATLFSTLIVTVLVVGGISFLLFYFVGESLFRLAFSNEVFTYHQYGKFVVVTSIFSIIQAIVLIYFRNFERLVSYSIYAIFFFLSAALAIYIGVVVFEAGAEGSVIGRMFGVTIPSLIFIVFFYLKYPIRFNVRLFKQLFRYGINIVPYLLLTLLFNNIDKLIIERKLTLADLGIYSFAFLAAGVMEILINAFQNTFTPKVYKLLGTSSPEKELTQLYRFFLWSMFTIIILSIAVSEFAVIHIIDAKYHSIIAFLPLLLVSYIARLYFVIYSTPIFYFKKTKLLPVISSISLALGLVTTLLLVEYYGIIGVCVGVLCTRMYQFTICFIFLNKFNIKHDFLRIPIFHLYAAITILYILLITILNAQGVVTQTVIPIVAHVLFTLYYYQNILKTRKDA